MTNKQRMIRILKRAMRLRQKAPLHYDACEMIFCALMLPSDDNLGNAEYELDLPILSKSSGTLSPEEREIHGRLADMEKLFEQSNYPH